MPVTLSSINALFTTTIQSGDADIETSSQAQAQRAMDKAWSLKRLFGNFARRFVGMQPVLTQEEIMVQTIRRLGALSPHLLADIGVEPAMAPRVGEVARPVQEPSPTMLDIRPRRIHRTRVRVHPAGKAATLAQSAA
jgi:hypothetical protein